MTKHRAHRPTTRRLMIFDRHTNKPEYRAAVSFHPVAACESRRFTLSRKRGVFSITSMAVEHCALHQASNHPLRDAELVWIRDSGLNRHQWKNTHPPGSYFGRQCEHGRVHPDPDAIAYHIAKVPRHRSYYIQHPCDGCCGVEQPRPTPFVHDEYLDKIKAQYTAYRITSTPAPTTITWNQSNWPVYYSNNTI